MCLSIANHMTNSDQLPQNITLMIFSKKKYYSNDILETNHIIFKNKINSIMVTQKNKKEY